MVAWELGLGERGKDGKGYSLSEQGLRASVEPGEHR